MQEKTRRIPLFTDLTDEQYTWLESQSSEVHLAAGDILFHEGEAPTCFHVVLTGELQITKQIEGQDTEVDLLQPGMFTGDIGLLIGLPHIATARALQSTDLLVFSAETFQKLVAMAPAVGHKMLPLMGARVQGAEALMREREKLAALGKLSAGLAHELNNPASAGQRASAHLHAILQEIQRYTLQLTAWQFSPEQQVLLDQMRQRGEQNTHGSGLDALEQSDREEEITSWLDEYNIQDGWQLAPVLVEAGVSTTHLNELATQLPSDALGTIIPWLVAMFTADRLLGDIGQSMMRIADLVHAIKSYSHMDQTPQQEIDIHDGIENTLTILGYKLKHKQITVAREYDRTLPHITAYGSELNQVWTNLIDNAIDAMQAGGHLRIRTARDGDFVLVEISDDGQGILPELLTDIFQPFFTTKRMGEGSGLGLDICYRIVVNRHHGDIRVTSQPGETRFIVLLPRT